MLKNCSIESKSQTDGHAIPLLQDSSSSIATSMTHSSRLQAFMSTMSLNFRFLLSSHRTATLRQDNESQATLLNIMLKNHLVLNQIDQADKLISKAVFPDTVGNNQLARYMYYLGRIKAIQLDYSESHRNLLQAIRKAPQTVATAGFQQAVTSKILI